MIRRAFSLFAAAGFLVANHTVAQGKKTSKQAVEKRLNAVEKD